VVLFQEVSLFEFISVEFNINKVGLPVLFEVESLDDVLNALV